jgi:RHS repeat-associated protein
MISYTPAAGLTGTKTATAGEAAEWVAQQIAIAPGISTTTTKFLWDINHAVPQVALERDAADVLQRRYLYGHQRIAQTAGTLSYYHADSLGSVAHLTSDTGATQRTLAYEPFGIERTNTGSGPGTLFKFTGEYQDATDLYHLRARQYDPATGRFLSRDPIETAGSAYAYVGNQPTVFVDPSGLQFGPVGEYLRQLNSQSRDFLIRMGENAGQAGHLALDVVGAIPGAEPADLLNCAWYGAEGNYVDASFSCLGAVPIFGWAALAGKWGRKTSDALDAADGPISMDEAVARGAAHVGGRGEMVATPRGNYQFIGEAFTNAAGDTQRNIARFDVQNLRAGEVPHLNMEIQINGIPQPFLDPHTPIVPSTIRPGDYP